MKSPKLAVVVGEESGDARAAAMLSELRRLCPGARFFGVGGPRCAALGEPTLGGIPCWTDRAAVVGLWDVLRQYPFFRAQFAHLRRRIVAEQPDAVVYVDYPGFNLRLASALRPLLPQTHFIYYISPQVWAWNRGRIPRMARWLDLMLCLFPFETALYAESGLATECVGHPLVEELVPWQGKTREENLLGLFPGSRDREVHRIFPEFLGALRHLRASVPEMQVEVAAVRSAQAEWMREQVRQAGWAEQDCRITLGEARLLMARATVGLVCSGTASLEAALLGLPYALVYKVHPLTYAVGRRLVRVNHLGMVNILAGQTVVREFIQHDCRPFFLADEVLRLWNNPPERARLQEKMRQATAQLGGNGASRRAAEAIAEQIRRPRQPK